MTPRRRERAVESGDGWERWQVPAELRELMRGNKPSDPDEFLPHLGLVDEPTKRRLLSHLASTYDPTRAERDMPADVRETRLWKRLLEPAATDTLSKAIFEGDAQTQSFAVGDPGAVSDVSGIKAIERLRDLLTQPAFMAYIFGPPGSGKTNLALLLAQIWDRQHEETEIASNISSWREKDEWVQSFGELRAWLDRNLESVDGGGVERIDDPTPMLFVFDEASSHASGRGESGAEAGKKLAPMVYQIRKSNANLIIVGHDGKDVHPAVRTLSYPIEKRREELTRATVWEDVKEREGRDKIMEVRGLPETDYSYDDGEATEWSWSEYAGKSDDEVALEKAQELAADMLEEEVRELAAYMAGSEWLDLDQREIGRALGEAVRGEPFSRTWVSKWHNRLDGVEESDGSET